VALSILFGLGILHYSGRQQDWNSLLAT